MSPEAEFRTTRGPLARLVGRSLLRVLGWKLVGSFPEVPKAVFIASPHTSNLDGVLMVSAAYAMGLPMSWLGKDSMFVFPLGQILRSFGGIPIDRSERSDTVKQSSEQFAARSSMYLAIAPAGTRKKNDYWKSGFYQIALRAQVPLLCGCVDYARKEAGIIGIVEPTGDMVRDMDRVREIYEGRMGKHPERMTRIRLVGEDQELRAVQQG